MYERAYKTKSSNSLSLTLLAPTHVRNLRAVQHDEVGHLPFLILIHVLAPRHPLSAARDAARSLAEPPSIPIALMHSTVAPPRSLIVVAHGGAQPPPPEAGALGKGGEAATSKRGAGRGTVRGTVFQRRTAAAAEVTVTVTVAAVRVGVVVVAGKGDGLGRLREAGEAAPAGDAAAAAVAAADATAGVCCGVAAAVAAAVTAAVGAGGRWPTSSSGGKGAARHVAAGVGRGGAGEATVREG